eukprot:scaffold21076_cov132-Isochrysis_galbana.AAC.2
MASLLPPSLYRSPLRVTYHIRYTRLRGVAGSVIVSYRPRSDARYEGSRRPFVSIPPSVLELRLVNQSINQSLSCQSQHMLAILARQVPRIRAKSLSPTRHLNRAWFSPLSMRCLRPCTPPVRLFSVYSPRVQPSIRQFGRPSGSNNGCRRFCAAWSASFCLLLVPGAKECPQARRKEVCDYLTNTESTDS